MTKFYTWQETTSGHIMIVNGQNKWFIRNSNSRWEVYEIVQPPAGCVLHDICFSLSNAKYRAYIMECNEHNQCREMTVAN